MLAIQPAERPWQNGVFGIYHTKKNQLRKSGPSNRLIQGTWRDVGAAAYAFRVCRAGSVVSVLRAAFRAACALRRRRSIRTSTRSRAAVVVWHRLSSCCQDAMILDALVPIRARDFTRMATLQMGSTMAFTYRLCNWISLDGIPTPATASVGWGASRISSASPLPSPHRDPPRFELIPLFRKFMTLD